MPDIIVVGSDGSETSRAAVRRAAELAIDLRSELHIAIVYEKGHGVEIAPLLARGGKTETMLEATKIYTSSRGEQPVFALLAGDAADMITAYCSDVKARLAVVGSVGMGGRLKSSVPARVARDAPCDVYIVRTA